MSIEEIHVKQVYNKISNEFNHTRYRPWTCVEKFLDEVPKNSKIGDIGAIVKGYREKTESLSFLATEYNSEIDYLSSLEILNTICSEHDIRIDEIMPRLENTLPQIQSVLTDPKHIVERYALDLRVDGRFLSVGELLDELVDNDFIVRNLEFASKPSGSNVKAIIGLYSYRLIAK